jgi:outer membrane receptor protein involved in Fe transport
VYANPNDIIGQVNALQSPPSGVFNARAALNFDDDRYEVALWGRNILNNRDVIGASSIPDDNVADMRRPPAMYGFTVAANF